jgi:RNA polymerase sigma-70 factor, ECF subfamily
LGSADDENDVAKVLSGDVAAFESIVRRWQGPLVNFAYRFCRDRGRAEDMAQEAFLRTYRSLAGWRKDAAFSTWLFALATNLYRSELRRIPMKTISIDEAFEPKDLRDMHADLETEHRERAVWIFHRLLKASVCRKALSKRDWRGAGQC